MEVMLAVIVLRVFHATMAIALFSAMQVNGVVGARALSPVDMALALALAP
jgi:hypothetical protein